MAMAMWIEYTVRKPTILQFDQHFSQSFQAVGVWLVCGIGMRVVNVMFTLFGFLSRVVQLFCTSMIILKQFGIRVITEDSCFAVQLNSAAIVMHVEVQDYMLFCLAKVTYLTSNATIVGVLGDWWIVYSSSSRITALGLSNSLASPATLYELEMKLHSCSVCGVFVVIHATCITNFS